MQQFYGIDLSDKAILEGRSARWLDVRVAGLLDMPRSIFNPGSRIAFVLRPPKDEGK